MLTLDEIEQIEADLCKGKPVTSWDICRLAAAARYWVEAQGNEPKGNPWGGTIVWKHPGDE